MNDRSFTKLFSTIVTSSMWSENSDTRVVWVTMLALCNQHGEVLVALPGLARVANVPIESCRVAVEKFLSPDPDSRTPDYEGRRIEIVSGGWRLLNYEAYRQKMDEDERREYKRIKELERRERLRGHGVDKRGQNGHKQKQKQKQKQKNSTPIVPDEVKSFVHKFWIDHPSTKRKLEKQQSQDISAAAALFASGVKPEEVSFAVKSLAGDKFRAGWVASLSKMLEKWSDIQAFIGSNSTDGAIKKLSETIKGLSEEEIVRQCI